MIKYFLNGITVDERTMAIDTIRNVGPGGNFLIEDHTLEHFRSLWRPRYIDRSNFYSWTDNGSKDLNHKLNGKVIDILSTHNSRALEGKILHNINKILDIAIEKHTVKKMDEGYAVGKK